MTTFSPFSISFHTQICYFLPKTPPPIENYCKKYFQFTSFQKNWSKLQQPIYSYGCSKFGSFSKNWSKLHRPTKIYCQSYSKFGAFHKNGFLWGEKILKNKRRVVLVKSNQGFNFNGGDGNKIDTRVLVNLGLAVGLTYFTMTGQLGWVLDTIVSLWLLSIVLPIVAFGAFLWWAKRDVVQSACPNCGNEFQIFKSTLNDELQLCPFCSQPFSVDGNEFVKEPIKFSNRSTPFGQTFDDFSPRSGKGKGASTTIVDVEADVQDAD